MMGSSKMNTKVKPKEGYVVPVMYTAGAYTPPLFSST